MSSGAGAGVTFLGTGAGVKKSDSDHLWFSTSVSNSGQNFKTHVSGSWEKKLGKTQFFSGFEMNAILSDETHYHCEITTVGHCTIY